MKNGCHNRAPLKESVAVQDGWTPAYKLQGQSMWIDQARNRVRIPFRMNPECQYTYTELGKTDKGCDGCKHRKA